MTNFQFLLPEFRPLVEPATGAEQLVYSSPCACRHAPASQDRVMR